MISAASGKNGPVSTPTPYMVAEAIKNVFEIRKFKDVLAMIRTIFGRREMEGIAVFFDQAPAHETGAVIQAEQIL